MSSRLSRCLALTGSVLVLVLSVAALPPAGAAGASYVALGDSYSSGTGTREYLDDGTECERSVYAYPSLIASARGYALDFRACSGSRVAEVRSAQLDALGAGTAYVTISVGGNDAGFADVLTECAMPAWASDCNAAIDGAQQIINTSLSDALASLYAEIRNRAPNAKVVAVGYPRLFNGEDCNALTWFSPEEEERLNQTADLLNGRTASAAAAAGLAWADPTSAFIGHAVCGAREWLNGLSNPIGESYHPNRDGHSAGYTPLVSPALTGVALAPSAATMRKARSSADDQAVKQRRHAADDAGIEPQRFRSPDLDSARVRAAAERAGVDLDSRVSIDAADRRYSRAQAREWSARH